MICRIILSLFYEFFLLRHEEKGQDIMKSLQQKLGEALPCEEQAAYEQTARETKRIFRNRFLIWLGITTGAAVILSVLLRLTAHISPVITAVIVQRTKLGREMKMYGTNNRATVYSGLNNFKIVVCTHMFSGMLAALSGIIMWGRYSSAKADTGATYTMQAILIAVLGGVSPLGGSGSVTGIVLAVLIIQMLSSLLNMYTFIPTACRQIVWGGLLLIVMIVNFYLDQRKKNRH